MVKAWRERVVIPTYEVGAPEKNPLFLEKRVYQGSSGVVYPYPMIESISDNKTDHEYEAVFIENEYIKVMILPELGGRVQMAYDKIRQRHFIYYNQVVKPALVGLAGPWISGGIEFNWPQHHRPSTFMPVDCTIEEAEDGSVTVWVNEMERMFHQRGQAGFTLRPGCAYLEIKGVLCNRTEMPQTFLWWANPAVSVNDHYQSVFPPDINAVFDHGKRAVSSFPIATGTYYKMDYSAGVDISNYKNIPVPTSYMAVNSRFNFEGGYENDTQAGMLHVANHNISPGKKQWTWGNGDFGQAWDRNLTDEDGPYIELMAGVYTENQPDFTWLQPYEEKAFVQYFLPYRELGIVKNASKDILLNIDPVGEGKVQFKLFATSSQEVRIVLRSDDGDTLYNKEHTLTPESVLVESVATNVAFNTLNLEIYKAGKLVLDWHTESDEVKPIPDAAEAALPPAATKSCEQLYLTGLHLEQYRHASWSPVDYYEEALKRDPLDVRNNNALGLWYIRHGRFDKAESYLRCAVKVLQKRNPNPYDGEPIYNLGLCLKYQGRYDEAYSYFYKSTWNAAWQDVGYFACAQISAMQERWDDALWEIDRSLVRNWHNHQARALKAAILQKMSRCDDALQLCAESLQIDRFNYGCRFVKLFITGEGKEELVALLRDDAHNYDEIALDFANAGLKGEAIGVWKLAEERGAVGPMTYYYWALTDKENEVALCAKAAAQDSAYCFPNRLEAILALRNATRVNPNDAKALYYSGNLYYDKRQYDIAVEVWEKSAELDSEFPTVWRNLSLAYYNKQKDNNKALHAIEKAFSLDTTDSRVFMELDQLYKRLHKPHSERYANFCKFPELIAKRDDLVLEEATLLNMLGEYDDAKAKLDSHTFHPWEGGEGKVSAQYQFCRIELARNAITNGNTAVAVGLLEECMEYPHHLGEGKLFNVPENDFHYWLGVAYQSVGENDKACEWFEKAAKGALEPAAAMYYNDAKPEKIFYQGMALKALGRNKEANSRFHALVTYGEKHMFDKVVMDYFAVSLPDQAVWEGDLQLSHDIHCRFMLALGYYGLGDSEKAIKFLNEVTTLDPEHQGALAFKLMIA